MFIITKTTYLAVKSHALDIDSSDSFYDFEEFYSSIDIRKSVLNNLFYPLYMLRRLIHAAILLCIDDGKISSSVIACTTIMFWIYVLLCKPFKNKAENWVLIVEEGMNSINSVLVFLLNFDLGHTRLDIMSKLAMTSVLGFLCFFTFLSLAILIFKVLNWYKRRNNTPGNDNKVTMTSISIPYSSSYPNPSMVEFSFKAPGNDIPTEFNLEDHGNMQTSRSFFEEIYSK